MALVTCPECKRPISNTIDSCPHCGYQIKLSKEDRKCETEKEALMTLVTAVVVITIVILAIFFCSSPSPKIKTSDLSSASSSNTENDVITSPEEVLPPLDNYVGQHPREIFKEPAIVSKFQSLLIDPESYGIFRPRIDVSSGVELKNGFYVGAGCLPHACGSDEAAFAINRRSGEAYAIMIVDGKQITWYGVKDASALPAPLLKWFNEHNGPSVVAAGGSADLEWETTKKSREMQQWRYAAEKFGGSTDGIEHDLKHMTYSAASPIPGKFNYWLFMMGISLHKEPFPEGITWKTIGSPKATGKNTKSIWIEIRDPHHPAYYMRTLEEADCAKGLKKNLQINTYINDGTLVKSWKENDKHHYEKFQGKTYKLDGWMPTNNMDIPNDIFNAICMKQGESISNATSVIVSKENQIPAQPNIPISDKNKYDYLITKNAEKFKLDFALIKAVIKVGSNFNPQAVSPIGSQGLMQLMPATASALKVEDSFNPEKNIEGGSRYLRYLLNVYNGNLDIALAAYYAGQKAVTENNYNVPSDPETQNYVRCVLSFYKSYSNQ